MVRRNGNRDLKVEFVGQRILTDSEADAIRTTIAAMRPKMHLVMANWRWLEARRLGEQKAAQLIEAIDLAAGDSRRLFRRGGLKRLSTGVKAAHPVDSAEPEWLNVLT